VCFHWVSRGHAIVVVLELHPTAHNSAQLLDK